MIKENTQEQFSARRNVANILKHISDMPLVEQPTELEREISIARNATERNSKKQARKELGENADDAEITDLADRLLKLAEENNSTELGRLLEFQREVNASIGKKAQQETERRETRERAELIRKTLLPEAQRALKDVSRFGLHNSEKLKEAKKLLERELGDLIRKSLLPEVKGEFKKALESDPEGRLGETLQLKKEVNSLERELEKLTLE